MMEQPMHPGRALAVVMTKRCLTIDDLVAAGVPARTVNDLLGMHTDRLTTDTAAKLASATGLSVEWWRGIEEQYRARPIPGARRAASKGVTARKVWEVPR